jgi:hypothetical protein
MTSHTDKPIVIDTELISLANAALQGKIADPMRRLQILKTAERHLFSAWGPVDQAARFLFCDLFGNGPAQGGAA